MKKKNEYLKKVSKKADPLIEQYYNVFTSTEIIYRIKYSWFGDSIYVYISFKDHDEFLPVHMILFWNLKLGRLI